MTVRAVVAFVVLIGCSGGQRAPGPPRAPGPLVAPASPGPVTGLAIVQVWGGIGAQDLWRINKPRVAAIAPDGRWAVVGGLEGVALFDLPSGARRAVVDSGGVTDPNQLVVSPDSRRFAVLVRLRACVAVWTVEPLREEACFAAPRDARVAFSVDGAAVAIFGEATLARWSLATHTQVWTRELAPFDSYPNWLAWPASDVIVIGGARCARGYDAGSGAVRWEHDSPVDHYVGKAGGDVLVAGELHEGRRYGVLARLDLASGALRDLTASPDQYSRLDVRWAVALDDGTALLIDGSGIAHRYRPGSPEFGTFVLPENAPAVAAWRDGRLGIVIADNTIRLWDLRAGTPLEVGTAQRGAIVALDADRDQVVSAADDGSVVVRRGDGSLVARRRARSVGCRAWAVDAPSRSAVCAAAISSDNLRALSFSHEWIELDSDRRGDVDWFAGTVVATDRRRTIWTAMLAGATWLDGGRAGRAELPNRRGGYGFPVGPAEPRRARLVGGGRAVAFGGAQFYETPHGEISEWTGLGLRVMTRDGTLTQLDDRMVLLDLASDRAGDRLAIATLGSVEVWDQTGGLTSWRRRWAHERAGVVVMERLQGPPPIVALAEDGSLLAVTEASGRTIALHDAATGARIAAIAIGEDRHVTALAFGGDALYAGTSTGVVVVVALQR